MNQRELVSLILGTTLIVLFFIAFPWLSSEGIRGSGIQNQWYQLDLYTDHSPLPPPTPPPIVSPPPSTPPPIVSPPPPIPSPIVIVLEIPIDIKPGGDPNSINCTNENGVIPVAILTFEDFDATTVDHTMVTFEGASETHVDKKTGQPRRHEEDVDGDRDTDLVFHFRLGDTTLTCDATDGTLTGETFDGQIVEGTDTIRMIDQGGGQP